MLRTWVRGRRGAAVGAALGATVCLGTVAALGGGDGPEGYVAVGAAGGSSGSPGKSAAPDGKVRLLPLDSAPPGPSGSPPGASGPPEASGTGDPANSAGAEGTSGASDTPGASGTSGAGASAGGASASSGAASGTEGAGTPGGSGTGTGGNTTPRHGSSASGSPGGTTAPSPAGPAALTVSEPVLADAGRRWCQDVTLLLRNSGGSAVRSGTVTFETHVIGALGVDWATLKSAEKLPVPLGAGEEKKKTWTVCVASWRVPLGMHVETRDVSVDWA
ncbi:hypothetical protein [Streptomyces sp. NPDC006552]|uniref:hypothetical protein n=1 Tax=Streptomyces sp. NPDC006552 TaxID=3157179 RepID=UPI0033A8D2DA